MTVQSFVIVIGGASGAGKTTLAKQVAECLGDAIALHFDDYKSVAEYPTDLARWVAEGKDLNAWKIPQLHDDLRALRYGRRITLPDGKGEVAPARFIILEEPSGCARVGMRDLIDFVVLVDIPLEIALARKVVQDLQYCLTEMAAAQLAWAVDKVASYIANYELARTYYLTCIARVCADSDLVIDGTKPTAEQASRIIEAVQLRLGE